MNTFEIRNQQALMITRTNMIFAPFKNILIATLVLASIAACAPRVDVRGNSILPADLAAIKVGTFTRNNVLDKLGSPSNMSEFGDEIWYYISETTETTAFLAPKITKRQIAFIKFDKQGVVTEVNMIDGDKTAQKIIPAEGETPTAGNSLSFIDQIISNFGRFNNK